MRADAGMHEQPSSRGGATSPFPIDDVRRQFPALERAGPFVFFDNAAGAQIPAGVLAAVTDHLLARNVQRGGPYRRSREVDAMIARARASVAALVNARSADEIAFGLNATSFIRAISLAIGQTLGSRPEIVVSELDHEANIATWLALERFGARILWWRVRPGDRGNHAGRLDTADLEPLLTERTRLVACTVASNATGGIVDVTDVARRAHGVGAEVFLDGVHYAPHGAIDVQAVDCDYNVAGMDAAVSYLENLGRCLSTEQRGLAREETSREETSRDEASRKELVHLAMNRIAAYERELSHALLEAVADIPGVTVHGVTDRERLGDRVPTLCFTVAGVDASAVAARLAERDMGVRSGHMYSPRLMARLGLMPAGAIRASLVHYNTVAEIGRFRDALHEVVDDRGGSW
jgi:selenocysteine lyase/cysteine desulfurase